MSAGDFDLIVDPLQLGRVRYLVVGGVAVVLHGHPRFTAGLGGVKVPVASIEDLVALKRAA